MEARLYPSLDVSQDLLEVVDANNTPLCIMNARDVQLQQLPYRAVGLLARDRSGRTLLSRRPGIGWGISSFSRLRAGHAHEQLARELLRADWRQEGQVLPLGLLPPGPALHAFIYLYEARIPAWLAADAARDAGNHMLVDYDELRGLGTHFGDLLSPVLRSAVQAGLVRPR